MTSSSRGGTTSKSKESSSFHLEAHVSYILRHSLLQVVLIAYISTKNSSMINNVTMWSTPLVWQFLCRLKANRWCVGIYSVVTCVMWSMECHVTTLYVHVYGINQMTVVRWKDVMYIVNDIG